MYIQIDMVTGRVIWVFNAQGEVRAFPGLNPASLHALRLSSMAHGMVDVLLNVRLSPTRPILMALSTSLPKSARQPTR
jgi:hypothetical protein